MVSVQDFLKAFSQQWNADQECRGVQPLRDAYQDDDMWTAYMQGRNRGAFPDTFLDRLAERLGQKAIRERQYLDVVYYTEVARNAPQDRIRPVHWNVIIEHENGEDVEKEMWKMLQWRAPLKVLIFYDWPPWRQTTPDREDWLVNKLDALFDLRREVDASWPEAIATTYLFLTGKPPQPGTLPDWRYCDSTDQNLRPLRL